MKINQNRGEEEAIGPLTGGTMAAHGGENSAGRTTVVWWWLGGRQSHVRGGEGEKSFRVKRREERKKNGKNAFLTFQPTF